MTASESKDGFEEGVTVVLARVALKQTRDARILQRAHLNVKFGGIQRYLVSSDNYIEGLPKAGLKGK